MSSYNELGIIYERIKHNQSLKAAIYVTEETLNILTTQKEYSWPKLKEEIYSQPVGIGFKLNNFFYFVTDEIIQKLLPTGILEQSYKFHFEYLYKDKDPIVFMPQVLTFDDLSQGFFIWLSACGISVIAFIIEIILNAFNKLRRSRKLKKIKYCKIHPMTCSESGEDPKSFPNVEALHAFQLKKPVKIKCVKVYPIVDESYQTLINYENQGENHLAESTKKMANETVG